MDFNEYQKLAERTSRFRGEVFDPTASPHCEDGHSRLTMAAMGVAGEAGEFTDLAKKVLFHDHPLDHLKAYKELGDVLWYVAEACSALGVSLEQVAATNIEKLRGRYPEKFTSEHSINRKPGDA